MGSADPLDAAPRRARLSDLVAPRPADRVSVVCSRRSGLVFTVSAILTVIVPALDRWAAFAAPLAGMLAMLLGFALVATRVTWAAALLVYVAGLATLVSLASLPDAYDFTAVAAVTAVSSLALPSLLLVVPGTRTLLAAAGAALVPVAASAIIASAGSGRAVFVAIAVVGGWTALTCAALWLQRSERQAQIGVEQLRSAYAAERASVEAEAGLRHEARTMHDTVLATLTLLSHGGRGVPPETLRAQAAADRDLLRQLRSTGTLSASSPPRDRPITAAAGRSPRWDLLLARHSSRGLSVTCHGAGGLDDSAPHLDELAAAVSECLENVRRHSGQDEAEVTLSQAEDRTRAVVTDVGSGFEPERVPAGRLGLAESVRARLDAVGGSARIFSSPGRGTTVLLEVPR